MKKVFFLSTCSTCTRILNQIQDINSFKMQDIKSTALTEGDLEEMRKRTDSYESLFSRRAMKFRSQGLHEKNLQEEDFKQLILEEYTFLKRPVFIIDDKIFIGNSKKMVESMLSEIQ